MDRSAEDGLRNGLINETVIDAVRYSDFYRKLYGEIDVEQITSIEDLSLLPTIDKEAVREAGEAMLCEGKTCGYMQNTSGSTGELLVMFRSIEEAEFIQEFFMRVHASKERTGLRSLVLSLATPSHGTPTAIPSPQFVLSHAIIDNETALQTVRILRRSYTIPGVESRVTLLSGALSQILILTEYIMAENIPAEEFGIQYIIPTGRYVTRRFRTLLEKFWGAVVIDRYSLSEIFGGATSCGQCGGYHFDPQVIPEVIDLKDSRVLDKGVGALVLTSLSPFVQLHPFIRYRTGDLFSLDPDICAMRSYRFLGRIKHSLFDPVVPDRILLNGVDLWEVLDQLPIIRRTERSQTLTNLQVPIAAGTVRHRNNTLSVELNVEAVTDLRLFTNAQEEVEEDIRKSLLEVSPNLSDDIENGSVEFVVRVVPPGTLPVQDLLPFEKKTPLWQFL